MLLLVWLLLRLRLLLLLPMTTSQQDLLLLDGPAARPFLRRFIPATQLILQLGVGRRHPVLVGLEEIASETDSLYTAPAEVDQAGCGKKENRNSIETGMNNTAVEESLYKRGALTDRRSGRRKISVR